MKRLALILAAIALFVALTACHPFAVFDGSMQADEQSVRLEYTLFNRQQSACITLAQGESLRVSIAQEEGTVDVTVGVDEEEAIYEGRGLTRTDFTLNIAQTGVYQITATGHRARGRVDFLRRAPAPSSLEEE